MPPKRKYCLCRKGDDGVMISCDNCAEWFHCQCIGLSGREANSLKEWLCFVCERLKKSQAEERQHMRQICKEIIKESTDERVSKSEVAEAEVKERLLNEIAVLKNESESLRGELEDSKESKNLVDKEKADLIQEREGLLNQVTVLENNMHSLRQEFVKLNEAKDLIVKERTSLYEEKNSLMIELKDLRKERESLKNELKEMKLAKDINDDKEKTRVNLERILNGENLKLMSRVTTTLQQNDEQCLTKKLDGFEGAKNVVKMELTETKARCEFKERKGMLLNENQSSTTKENNSVRIPLFSVIQGLEQTENDNDVEVIQGNSASLKPISKSTELIKQANPRKRNLSLSLKCITSSQQKRASTSSQMGMK